MSPCPDRPQFWGGSIDPPRPHELNTRLPQYLLRPEGILLLHLHAREVSLSLALTPIPAHLLRLHEQLPFPLMHRPNEAALLLLRLDLLLSTSHSINKWGTGTERGTCCVGDLGDRHQRKLSSGIRQQRGSGRPQIDQIRPFWRPRIDQNVPTRRSKFDQNRASRRPKKCPKSAKIGRPGGPRSAEIGVRATTKHVGLLLYARRPADSVQRAHQSSNTSHGPQAVGSGQRPGCSEVECDRSRSAGGGLAEAHTLASAPGADRTLHGRGRGRGGDLVPGQFGGGIFGSGKFGGRKEHGMRHGACRAQGRWEDNAPGLGAGNSAAKLKRQTSPTKFTLPPPEAPFLGNANRCWPYRPGPCPLLSIIVCCWFGGWTARHGCQRDGHRVGGGLTGRRPIHRTSVIAVVNLGIRWFWWGAAWGANNRDTTGVANACPAMQVPPLPLSKQR